MIVVETDKAERFVFFSHVSSLLGVQSPEAWKDEKRQINLKDSGSARAFYILVHFSSLTSPHNFINTSVFKRQTSSQMKPLFQMGSKKVQPA